MKFLPKKYWKQSNPKPWIEHIQVEQQGGSVARNARKRTWKQTGKAVGMSPLNDKKKYPR